MQIADLRIALFSGNYNYVRDGANQALNRLVGHLLKQGAKVRVYAPVVDEPAFEPTGDLVGIPAVRMPVKNRGEYRFPLGLNAQVKDDLAAFNPNIMHVSSPDAGARGAVKWAKAKGLPVLASVHTRFETYPRYYKLGFMEKPVENWLRRMYQQCDALVAPSPSMVDVLREQGMNDDISLWSRGVDRDIFHPSKRDQTWRQQLGIADNDVAIGFLGRLVMEKGLDVFTETIAELNKRGVAHKVLLVGDGPEREYLDKRLPGACFAGFQSGADLGRAVACMDVLFNPSVTETFGNVTLEAMACGVPVVAAQATGSESLVACGSNGRLIAPSDITGFADALQAYCESAELRAAHGAAGSTRADDFEWDAINQSVADTYVRLANRVTEPA